MTEFYKFKEFKKQFKENWVSKGIDGFEYTLEFNDEELKSIEKRSLFLFRKWDILDKYEEIVEFLKNVKELEFQGNNIKAEFAKFHELANKIEEIVNVTKLWLKEFQSIENSLRTGSEVEYLKDVKLGYTMNGELSEFYTDYLNSSRLCINKIFKLIKDLQDLSYWLQYNLVKLYLTDEALSSYFLNKRTDSNISGNVIFTVFSKASNYDVGKEFYFDRREIVKRVTTNIGKENIGENENSLLKILEKKEYNNNYTISYKNIYDDANTILKLDPLFSKVYDLLRIKSEIDLGSLNSIYYNLKNNSSDKDVINSMEKLMSSGFNRIVIVESDDVVLYNEEKNELLSRVLNNQMEGKDIGENVFNLYKENIEYIKYVKPWVQDYKEGEAEENNLAFLHEILAHLAKFKNKSEKINKFKKFNKQQLYIENTFSLERITLSNLVEKLRFQLFFDLEKNEYQNKQVTKLYEYLTYILNIATDKKPLLDLNINDDKFETKNQDKLISIRSSKEDFIEFRAFIKQNLSEVNNYLSHSLFIFYDLNWEEIYRKFLENRITLSSGLNNKKKYLDILSYKLSVLFFNLFGNDGYKFVSKSFNKRKTIKSSSEFKNNIQILDAKGFGQIHRFIVDEVGVSKDLKPIEIEKNNVYNTFLNLRTETETDKNLNYFLVRKGNIEKKIEEHKFSKELKKRQEKKNYEAMKEEFNRINYKRRRYHTCSKIISFNKDKDSKRFYSSNNLNKNKNDISKVLTIESFFINKQNIVFFYNHFLKESSYYFTEVQKILDDGMEKKINLVCLQNKIENYAVNYEIASANKKLFQEKDVGEYSPVVSTLNNFLEGVVNCLKNFISDYYINNYKNLIQGIEVGDKKVKFYLLIFVLEADYDKKKEEEDKKIKIYKNKSIKNTDSSKDFKENSVKRNKNIRTIVDIIVLILANVFFKSNSKSDFYVDNESSWGTITQSNLINKIGNVLTKRLPVDLPDNFFKGMEDMPEEDKIFIRNYYSNEFKIVKNTIEFKGEVGSTILDLLMNPDNNINLLRINKTVTIKNKKNIYISFSDTFIEYLFKKIYTPYKLPMLVLPNQWTENQKDGGYLNNEFKKFANIFLLHKSYKNSSTSEISKLQVDTINYLNKQKLKINQEILYLLIKEYYNKNSILYNGLNQLHPESTEDKVYKKGYSKNILSHNSKYMLYIQVLSIAILFKNFSFYITTFFDFRGRIYTESDFFSYQSEDMSKSLIEFEEGCILDNSNIFYVLQYLANLGGKSKLTIKNKEKWSINLINNLNITKDKLEHQNFSIKDVNFKEDFVKIFNIEFLINNELIQEIILKNKDKFQFIVLLFNLIDCLINKNKLFCTPISFDATCNGFQHLAAIFKDIHIAKISNVINDSDFPNDVYNFVAENVKKLIELEPDSDMKDKFLSINLTRNLLKKPVMTIPYNVGLEKLQNQLINDEHNFFELKKEFINENENKSISYFIVNKAICKNNESIQLSFKEFGKLTSFLYKGVYYSFPNLANYVKYTKKIADIFSALNIPIEWKTPAGMKVKMNYNKKESKTIKSLFSKLRLGSVSLPLTKMNHISNRIAFMPNFIHSMDATNIQFLIKLLKEKYKKEINLITIHDCFATTPNYMFELNKEIRIAFIMIYFQGDYIKSVHENFIKQIYSNTKLIYIKENDKLIKLNFEDIKNKTLSLDSNKEYVVEFNKKKYTIPRLPYNTNNWALIKKAFERIVDSRYFIN